MFFKKLFENTDKTEFENLDEGKYGVSPEQANMIQRSVDDILKAAKSGKTITDKNVGIKRLLNMIQVSQISKGKQFLKV